MAEEITEKALTPTLEEYFPRIDRLALAGATGAAAGLGLFLATMLLVLKGGAVVGPTLGLLGHYFPGYTVSAPGAFLGLLYGFVTGGALGWTFALLRNSVMLLYVAIVRRRVEWGLLRRFLEFV